MIRELVRLRDKNQLTLPAAIADSLAVEPGALLELILDPENDHVELRHAEVVRAGTAQAKREEQWAKEDIKQGRFSTFANPDELALHMKQIREQEAKELQEQVEALQQQVQGLVLDVRRMSAAAGVQVANLPLDLSQKA